MMNIISYMLTLPSSSWIYKRLLKMLDKEKLFEFILWYAKMETHWLTKEKRRMGNDEK